MLWIWGVTNVTDKNLILWGPLYDGFRLFWLLQFHIASHFDETKVVLLMIAAIQWWGFGTSMATDQSLTFVGPPTCKILTKLVVCSQYHGEAGLDQFHKNCVDLQSFSIETHERTVTYMLGGYRLILGYHWPDFPCLTTEWDQIKSLVLLDSWASWQAIFEDFDGQEVQLQLVGPSSWLDHLSLRRVDQLLDIGQLSWKS